MLIDKIIIAQVSIYLQDIPFNFYEGRLLKLGINANTGKAIRQSFSGKTEEVVLEKLKKQYIKNKKEGIRL